jgi:hypothetical protein
VPEAIELEGGAIGKMLELYDSASGNTAKMAVLVAEGPEVYPASRFACATSRRRHLP